jgi:pRiA4b ORF-3-like protein
MRARSRKPTTQSTSFFSPPLSFTLTFYNPMIAPIKKRLAQTFPIYELLPSDDDFYPGVEQRDERRFRLADIAQNEKASLIYEYDFGDGWEHEVVVEKVLAADSEKRAVCLDGKNARPPEDCGGIFGYYDLLKAINNPKHPEHQQLLDWLGGPFDPSHFDLQETNSLLRGLKI